MRHLILEDNHLDKVIEFLATGRKMDTGKLLSTIGALYLANDKGMGFLRDVSLKKNSFF